MGGVLIRLAEREAYERSLTEALNLLPIGVILGRAVEEAADEVALVKIPASYSCLGDEGWHDLLEIHKNGKFDAKTAAIPACYS